MISPSRYSFYDANGNFFVEIRTQKNIWFILLVLFYFGLEIPHRLHRLHGHEQIIQEILLNPRPDLLTFLVYTVGLLIVCSILLALAWLFWSLFGREVITIERGLSLLKIQYQIGNLKLVRTYHLNQIGNIRPAPINHPMESIFRGGNVAFDYEGKSRRFGWTLADEDAKAICAELKKYLPEKVHSLIR